MLPTIERLFRTLATECRHSLSQDEIGEYVGYLAPHGLERVKEACLTFIENGEDKLVFPSVFEFEKVILSLKKMETRFIHDPSPHHGG